MSEVQTEENLWKKMLYPVTRICGGCNKNFRCTGTCPVKRWVGDEALEFHSRTACYCEKCLRKSTSLGYSYVQARLRCCY